MDKVKVLSRYLPAEAAPLIARWIDYFNCEFKVARGRSSKFGDYRHPYRGLGHRISVNYDLNQYAFLITTVHEFAHLLTWNEHKRSAQPHGLEWKQNFKRMMTPFFEKPIFPEDIRQAIARYLEDPAASSCSDPHLFRVLSKYDKKADGVVLLEKVPYQGIFALKNGRKFQKGEKLRKRFKCVELSTGSIYLVHQLAEVYTEFSPDQSGNSQ